MAERILTGQRRLDKNLAKLTRSVANKIARAGLSKGARLAAKKIKAEIPSRQKSVRASIGSSVRKATSGAAKGLTTAKAGANVGRQTAAKQKRAAERAQKRGGQAGSGIGPANVHWYLLGTGERRHKLGRRTGRMPEHPVVKQAMSKGQGEVIRAIATGVKDALMREVKKLRK